MKHILTLLIVGAAIGSAHAQLIDVPTAPPPSAAEVAAKGVVQIVNTEIIHRAEIQRMAFQRLWHNPAATPAQVLQSLGTRAKLVFQFSAENLQHIQRCAELVGKTRADFIADVDCTPPVQLVFHNDGTVTIQP